ILDPQAVDRPFVVTEENIDRTTFYDNYTLAYKFGEKTSAYVQGLYSAIDYESGVRLLDLTAYSGTGGFAYQVFPKTVVFGEGYYRVTATAPNLPGPKLPEVSFVGGAFGARGNFTPKIVGTLRVGYETRTFANQTAAPSSPVVNL